MDEVELDEQGRLDLFDGTDPDSSVEELTSFYDDLIDQGWDPADPADHGDPLDSQADAQEWPAVLPADIRAEVLARPPLPTPLPADALAALGLDGTGRAAAGFAAGGFFAAALPGPWLGGALATATEDGHDDLDESELIGVLAGWQRQVAWTQARLVCAVIALANRRAEQALRPGWSGLGEHVTDELAVELTLTGRSAGRLLDVASGLGRLTDVHDALLSGTIDWARACVFVDELAGVSDAGLARQIATGLVDQAARWTTGQLRAALARAVLAADPDAAGRRRTRAHADSRVELWHEASGNAALAGRELQPADVILIDRKLTACAEWLRSHRVPGTLDQLRSVAYQALLAGRDLATISADPTAWPQQPDDAQNLDAGGDARCEAAPIPGDDTQTSGTDAATGRAAGPPPGAGPAGSIHLTMPLSTWLGGGEPGEVASYGPADDVTSRRLADLLAADPRTRWCLTLTGPDGRAVAHACARCGPASRELAIRWARALAPRIGVLAQGTCSHARQSASYTPPRSLRHAVLVRQRRCAFPGCRRPAARCDLDHTVPFDSGGLTCECNLAPLCRKHHRCKQTRGWHLEQSWPGVMTWRLPSGRIYHTLGEPYPT